MEPPKGLHWQGDTNIGSGSYTCGYCSNKVASEKGWHVRGIGEGGALGYLRLCPECQGPTFLYAGQQTPSVSYGSVVKHLPPEIEKLYNEARDSLAAGAPTATIMCCRKILMHVAVDKGATPGDKFVAYVNYLDSSHYIPPGAVSWVDKIRDWGNEANHEIKLKTPSEAEKAIDFTQMLLKVVYEYPGEAPTP